MWYAIYNTGPGDSEWSGIPRESPNTNLVGKSGFVRLEEHWNGWAVRPPVGMRADQASHEWLRDPFEIDEAGYVIGWRWELVPR